MLIFGEFQVGKSTLVNALCPGANADVGFGLRTTREAGVYPLPGCARRTELVDSPGVDGTDPLDEQRAVAAIDAADLVLFLLKDQGLSQKTREWMRFLSSGARDRAPRPIAVVLNCHNRERWDPALGKGICEEVMVALKDIGAMQAPIAGRNVWAINARWGMAAQEWALAGSANYGGDMEVEAHFAGRENGSPKTAEDLLKMSGVGSLRRFLRGGGPGSSWGISRLHHAALDIEAEMLRLLCGSKA